MSAEVVQKSLLNILERVSEVVSSSTVASRCRLVAVSKTKPSELITACYASGQRHFGENYIQELEEKSAALRDVCPEIRWHYIGQIGKICSTPNLYCVETIESEKHASMFDKEWSKRGSGQLRVLVQVNTSQETNKGGIPPSEAPKLATFIQESCSSLLFDGFMTIGSFSHSHSEGENPDFTCLHEVRDSWAKSSGNQSDSVELSMGMSDDFEQAIKQGSTSVRVGSKIFGNRVYQNSCNCRTQIMPGNGLNEARKILDNAFECLDMKISSMQQTIKDAEIVVENDQDKLFVIAKALPEHFEDETSITVISLKGNNKEVLISKVVKKQNLKKFEKELITVLEAKLKRPTLSYLLTLPPVKSAIVKTLHVKDLVSLSATSSFNAHSINDDEVIWRQVARREKYKFGNHTHTSHRELCVKNAKAEKRRPVRNDLRDFDFPQYSSERLHDYHSNELRPPPLPPGRLGINHPDINPLAGNFGPQGMHFQRPRPGGYMPGNPFQAFDRNDFI